MNAHKKLSVAITEFKSYEKRKDIAIMHFTEKATKWSWRKFKMVEADKDYKVVFMLHPDNHWLTLERGSPCFYRLGDCYLNSPYFVSSDHNVTVIQSLSHARTLRMIYDIYDLKEGSMTYKGA